MTKIFSFIYLLLCCCLATQAQTSSRNYILEKLMPLSVKPSLRSPITMGWGILMKPRPMGLAEKVNMSLQKLNMKFLVEQARNGFQVLQVQVATIFPSLIWHHPHALFLGTAIHSIPQNTIPWDESWQRWDLAVIGTMRTKGLSRNMAPM